MSMHGHSHLAHARHTVGRVPHKLHVVAVVFNPLRFQSRYYLYREFEQHALSNPEVELYTVELALGNRPFEVTQEGNPRHIQFRTPHELWHKERMINAAFTRLPADWQYAAWIDADVTFINPDWAHETIQQLQHYQIVQMFTYAMDLGADQQPVDYYEGFASSHVTGGRTFPALNGVRGMADGYNTKARYWHPGYGWAYRREAWDMLGGMLDINIVGGGDHQMAYALIGKVLQTIPSGSAAQYTKQILEWAERAALIRENIGAVPGTLVHHFHGSKAQRGYYDRWRILTDNGFDPGTDLKNDWQGMLALSGNKIALRDQLRGYFRQRNEDAR
jgi:hypothetical protein